MSDGGKGSAPRKQQDQAAYEKGWDQIFGNKPKHESWCNSLNMMLMSNPPKPAPCNCKLSKEEPNDK